MTNTSQFRGTSDTDRVLELMDGTLAGEHLVVPDPDFSDPYQTSYEESYGDGRSAKRCVRTRCTLEVERDRGWFCAECRLFMAGVRDEDPTAVHPEPPSAMTAYAAALRNAMEWRARHRTPEPLYYRPPHWSDDMRVGFTGAVHPFENTSQVTSALAISFGEAFEAMSDVARSMSDAIAETLSQLRDALALEVLGNTSPALILNSAASAGVPALVAADMVLEVERTRQAQDIRIRSQTETRLITSGTLVLPSGERHIPADPADTMIGQCSCAGCNPEPPIDVFYREFMEHNTRRRRNRPTFIPTGPGSISIHALNTDGTIRRNQTAMFMETFEELQRPPSHISFTLDPAITESLTSTTEHAEGTNPAQLPTVFPEDVENPPLPTINPDH